MHTPTTLLALAATVTLAWAAVPADLPATYTIHETDRMEVTAQVAGRRVTRHRRLGADGSLVLDAGGVLRFEDPDHLLPANEATWTPAGRSAVRFRFTEATKAAIHDEAAALFAAEGLRGRLSIRYGPGRLTFPKDGSTLRGTEVVRGTMTGRYAGRPFTAWATVTLSWRGARRQ